MTLRGLIEAVERGDNFGIIPNAQAVLGDFDPNYRVGETVCCAFHGSLDAAKALHNALLPGWAVELWAWADDDADARVYRTHTEKELEETWSFWAEVDGCNPARAWLLAILRAVEQNGTKTRKSESHE